jgi:chromosome segregation ATPase
MGLRTRLSRRITWSLNWRIAEHVEELKAELGRVRADLEGLAEQSRELDDRARMTDKRLAELESRLSAVDARSDWSANELARLAPQAAAFEARLEQAARPVVTAAQEDLPEARLLVETIREEHARVRARLALVSAYEERLRRLEQQARERTSS